MDEQFCALLAADAWDAELFEAADRVRRARYGADVYIRGLIEFTNYCKNDCYYCGIRRSNSRAERYRLTQAQILACCAEGYALGFRTFVLQGGEDPYFTDDRLCAVVSAIRKNHRTARSRSRSATLARKLQAPVRGRRRALPAAPRDGRPRALRPPASGLAQRRGAAGLPV